jgi:pimeloyl-ACP methyl ester carboxylesterase
MPHGSGSESSSPRTGVSAHGLYYRVEGRGPETVALIHGVGSSAATWSRLAPLLLERFRLVSYDLRGHGLSEKATGPYSLDRFVDDHLALLAGLEVSRSHLVGFSLGAIVAQGVALRAPETVDRLVLLNCIGGRSDEDRMRVNQRLREIRTSRMADLAARSATRWFTTDFLSSHPADVASEVNIVSATNHAAYVKAYEVLATNDLIDALDQLKRPTLLVTGADDVGSRPSMSYAMHDRIPESTVRIVPRLRHYLHIEAPELVAELISSFLSGSNLPNETAAGPIANSTVMSDHNVPKSF